jgi:hypothetical protein
MGLQWTNMLAPWQWAVLAAVPPALIALYFLKLKRQPLEVPSTYLWHKSIEDLHVNSLWQRLRRSLLLLLQLLLVLLAILALMGPSWKGTDLRGHRIIILIDNSASMASKDVAPSRLDVALRRAEELIDKLEYEDTAMIVAFSDRAQVIEPFSSNRSRLRDALKRIKQTNRRTSIQEALTVAAARANPLRSGDLSANQVSEAVPAAVYILSDGNFDDLKDFSLGNLDPVFMRIGQEKAQNVGVVAFSIQHNEEKTDQIQAFARLQNFAAEPVEVQVELLLDGQLQDADRVEIDAKGAAGVAFPLSEASSGVLEIRLAIDDAFTLDNRAWAPINAPRQAKVLFAVAEGGDNLMRFALQTERAIQLADVTVVSPEHLETQEYVDAASSGYYQLIIYDRCAPKQMPQSNTFFLGSFPPEPSLWKHGARAEAPQIVDLDGAHPLMQLIDLGNVHVSEASPLEVPEGGSVLIDSHVGPLFAIAPRESFEDAVLAFPLVEQIDGQLQFVTDWPTRLSFPVFVLNVLSYLGGQSQGLGAVDSYAPGQTITLRSDQVLEKLEIQPPRDGPTVELSPTAPNVFNFVGTEELGVYTVRAEDELQERFAVNLFDVQESRIPPRPDNALNIGRIKIEGTETSHETQRKGWKFLLMLALAVLLIEWYIYNRRVYL